VVGTVPQLPDSLKAGRVQGIEEIEPFASFAVGSGGVSVGDPFRSIGDEAYLGIFLADKTWADGNEDTVLKFNTALSKAADWIAQNEDASRDLLGTFSGAKGDTLASTPIPDFKFQTSAAEIASELGPDTSTWVDILKNVSDFQGDVKPADVLPSWAK
jgi:NitT/TauT family transport system substrate-binding protein